jgi:hypothetical protein
MRTLLQVLAVGAVLLLDAGSASASDCSCGQLSGGDCFETATIAQQPAEPLWCERSDDPRCMPANTHGTTVHTLVPVAMSWAQPLRWDAPPRSGVRMDIVATGEPGAEHSRRIERPPR